MDEALVASTATKASPNLDLEYRIGIYDRNEPPFITDSHHFADPVQVGATPLWLRNSVSFTLTRTG